MKYRLIILFCFIPLLAFLQTAQEVESEKLYKIHKHAVDYEKQIGEDSIFYQILDSFKLSLDKYTDQFGYDEVYHNIAVFWGRKNATIDPLTSIDFLKKNVEMAVNSGNEKAVALNQHEIGKIYFNLKQIPQAIQAYSETGKAFKELGDWHAYAYSIIDVANVYFFKAQYDIADEYYDKAYEVFKDELNKEEYYYGAALCYLNKGLIQEYKGSYRKALDYYKEALVYKKFNENEKKLSYVYQNIAKCYEFLNQEDSALFYHNLAIENDEKHNLIDELFYSYDGMGSFYLKAGDFKNAELYYRKSFQLAKTNNQVFNFTIASAMLGKMFLKQELSDSAIHYYSLSYDSSLAYGIMVENKIACEVLYSIYKELGDKEQELKYVTRLFEIEKINNTDNISRLQVQYEFEERIREKEEAEFESERLKMVILGITIAALFFAVFAVVIYRQRRKLKKINDQLEEKNKEIEKQAVNLEKANTELKKLDEFKDGLSSIIVHDLKNPASSILYLSDLLDEKDEKQILIKESAKQMLNLVHNILEVQKYESIEMKLDLISMSIKMLVDKAISQEQFLIEDKNLAVTNNIPGSIIEKIDSLVIERVIINLLTNAIKFTSKNGLIEFGYDEVSKAYFIKDNGRGISPEHQKIIFDKFSQVIVRKSGKAFSTGLGLTYCKIAIEAHGGKIWVESEIDKGSTFYFTLGK
jgi:signal transduction histidine kinase